LRTRPTAAHLAVAVVTAAFAFAVAAAPPSARAEDAYAIKLSRPSKVGDRFHVDAVGAIRTKTVVRTEGEDAPRTIAQAYGVSVDGTVKVVEVNDRGMETKLSLTVATCTATAATSSWRCSPRGRWSWPSGTRRPPRRSTASRASRSRIRSARRWVWC
jgi:hypothetical protein